MNTKRCCVHVNFHVYVYYNLLDFPSGHYLQENSKDSFLQPTEEQLGHQLPGGYLVLSPHLKWLASCGSDGRLTMRAVSALVSINLLIP